MPRDLFQPQPEPDSADRMSGASAGPDSPLADRMRPSCLQDVVGQEEIIGPHGPLRALISGGVLPSLLLWGPPGCGKTTLARLVAHHADATFMEFSAVSVGSRELKAVMAEAAKLKRAAGRRTILFLDEIHRFNKAQQDALLPWVERGDVFLVGATTENPSFEINSALISRTRLFILKPLDTPAVEQLLRRALAAPQGLNGRLELTPDALAVLAAMSEGDARHALGLLETVAMVADSPPGTGSTAVLDVQDVEKIIAARAPRYDKAGEEHFNIISALHKSLRNSDTQAGLYWLGRMLEGGEDPLYIARRLVRFASEDVGLADPQALVQAVAARDAAHFLGRPEGDLALAQAVVYLALSPKSNALYTAHKAVAGEVARGGNPPVPAQLRNAPTALMKQVGYGKGYVYAHDTTAGITAMTCLPDNLAGTEFYRPGPRGFEAELSERLAKIRRWQQRHLATGNDSPADAADTNDDSPGGST